MALALAACVLVVLSACAQAPAAIPPPAPSPQRPAPDLDAGPSEFTGGYLADYRPNWIGYLNLMQTGREVSGFMLSASPDRVGGTSASYLPVQGTTDGDSMTLKASTWLGLSNVTLTGRKHGDRLVLTAPASSGRIETLTFTAAPQNAYNNLLAGWQGELATVRQHEVAEQAAAHQRQLAVRAANQQVEERARALARAIDQAGDDTRKIQERLSRLKERLGEQQGALREMHAALAELKAKAAVRPMTQSQACYTVRNAYHYTLSNAYGKTLAKRRERFAEAAQGLEAQLGQVHQRATRPGAAAQALRDALAAAPQFGGTLVARPGDEAAPVATYQAAAEAAGRELTTLRAEDAANLSAADGLLAEGKSVMDAAVALVTC